MRYFARPKTPSQRLDYARQRAAMTSRFPGFRCRQEGGQLVFTGTLRPSPSSPPYEVEIRYAHGSSPRAFVLSPQLAPGAKHLFDDGSLCLFKKSRFRWEPAKLIAQYIIPWSAVWLSFYEGWVEMGIWYGPEAPHDVAPDGAGAA